MVYLSRTPKTRSLFFIPPVKVVEGGECGVGGGRVQGEEPEDVVCDSESGGEAAAGRADRDRLHGGTLTKKTKDLYVHCWG